MFALSSLYEIVKTFKRVLLFQVYMRKSALEQEQMVNALSSKQGTGTRMLARVMSNMPNNSSTKHVLQHTTTHKGVTPSAFDPHQEDPQSDRSQATSSSMRSSRSATVKEECRSSLGAAHMTPVPERSPDGIHFTTEQLPEISNSPEEKDVDATIKPHSSGCPQKKRSVGGRTFQMPGSAQGPDGVVASSRAASKERRENNLCMEIAQDIQRLEVSAAALSQAFSGTACVAGCMHFQLLYALTSL
jgi:hypothetical protein